MEKTINILLVSNELPLCNSFKKIIQRIPEVEELLTASSETQVVQIIEKTEVHFYLLDIALPFREILDFFSRKRLQEDPTPVLLVTPPEKSAVRQAIRALRQGADDIIPSPCAKPRVDLEEVLEELTRRIYCFTGIYGENRLSRLDQQALEKLRLNHISNFTHSIEAIAIGLAEGGTKTLVQLLESFSTKYSLPFLVVLQIHHSLLGFIAEILEDLTKFDVIIASHHSPINPGTIILAPGRQQMGVISCDDTNLIELTYSDHVSDRLPSIDYLFRSLSDSYGPRALAILAGGGSEDGISGLRLLKSKGGQVLCQKADTLLSREKVILALHQEIIDELTPLPKMAKRIQAIIRKSRKIAHNEVS